MIRYTQKVTGSAIYINKFEYCGDNTNDPINFSNIFESNISLDKINEVTPKWVQAK